MIAGCTIEKPEKSEKDVVYLSISPEIASSEIKTKHLVDGSYPFPLKKSSLWVEALNSQDLVDATNTQWYSDLGYNNIYFYRSGINYGWAYTLRGITTNMNNFLALFPSKGAKVNIYGFHPYMADLHTKTLTAIPFEVGFSDETEATSTNIDYMCTGAITYTLPASGYTNTVNIPFRHIMTLIDFQLTDYYVGTLIIKTMTVEAVDKTTGLPRNIFATKGTINAKTGAVTPDPSSKVSTITMTYNKRVAYRKAQNTTSASNSTIAQYTPCSIILPEIPQTDINNTELKVKFVFDGDGVDSNGALYGDPTFGEIVLDISSITTAGSIQGLKANYRYKYTIMIDNFIKYDTQPQIGPWIDDKDENGNNIIHNVTI